ncbi:MAG TPA: penicillin-binding transpeptidase domain-containing protein [Clostridia bacterium]|nr:penicillin-binding transpeptidase domain-containing protein [Clostridia bacterium]
MPNKYVKNVDLARMGFGQAITVTPLQLITSFSAIINGGKLMEPHLVKSIVTSTGEKIRDIHPTKVRNVISAKTSEIMRGILEEVVTSGSGKNAFIPGYRVGGKTGTAQKYENGVIASNKHIASFIGFAPADDPQIAVLFVVDEPAGYVHFGSIVAAPYVRDIIHDSLKYMGVPTRNLEQDLENNAATIEMPDLIGEDTANAEFILSELGLEVFIAGKGEIIEQYPVAGEKLSINTPVAIVGKEEDALDSYSSLD